MAVTVNAGEPLAIRRDRRGGIWRLRIEPRESGWHAWIDMTDPGDGHVRTMADAWAPTRERVLDEAQALLADPNIIPPGSTAWDTRRLPPPVTALAEELFAG